MALKTYQKALLLGIPILVGVFLIIKQAKASKSDLAPFPPPIPMPPDALNPNVDVSGDCSMREVNPYPKDGADENGYDWVTRSGSRLRQDHNTSSTILKTYPAGVQMYSIDEMWTEPSTGKRWYKVVESFNMCFEGWMREDVIDYVGETATAGVSVVNS